MDRKKSLEKKLKEFRNNLNKDFAVNRMLLFGSRATGKSHEDSDIDLIIVSKGFKGLNFMKRAARMYDYWNLDYPVDFLCFTPEEFRKKEKRIGIVRQATEEGTEIN